MQNVCRSTFSNLKRLPPQKIWWFPWQLAHQVLPCTYIMQGRIFSSEIYRALHLTAHYVKSIKTRETVNLLDIGVHAFIKGYLMKSLAF